MTNKILIIIFFLLNSLYIKCQTYISPFYGYGSSYLKPSDKFYSLGVPVLSGYDPYLYNYLHDGIRDFSTPVYFYKNHLFGLKINQNIGTRFEIDFESSFSATKLIPMATGDILLGVTSFGYNKYSFLFNLKWFPVKFLFLSVGSGVEKIKVVKRFTPFYGVLEYYNCTSSTQLNYNLAAGAIYKNFFCELKFIDGFKYIEGNDLLFYPISSMYGVIGYRLKIFPIKSNKKVDCPKF